MVKDHLLREMSLPWINHAILPDSIRLWLCQHLRRWSRAVYGCSLVREARASPGRMGLGLYMLQVMAVGCVMWLCSPRGRTLSQKKAPITMSPLGLREQLFLANFPLSSYRYNTGPRVTSVLDTEVCIVQLGGCSLSTIDSQAFLRC